MMRVYVGGSASPTARGGKFSSRSQRPQSGGQTQVYAFEQVREMADEMRKRCAAQSAQWNDGFQKMVDQLVEILQDDC